METGTSSGQTLDCSAFSLVNLPAVKKRVFNLNAICAVRQLDSPLKASLEICWYKMAANLDGDMNRNRSKSKKTKLA